MVTRKRAFTAIGTVLLSATSMMAQLTSPGNLLVLRVGDGTTALTNNAAAVTLMEFTSAGYTGADLYCSICRLKCTDLTW